MSITVPDVAVPTVPDPADQFQPLFGDQTEETILARWLDWANEGVDPVTEADAWVDTREGGHWRTVTMPGVREFARVYDLLNEVAQSGFVLWAWEVYLDDLASQWGVSRDPATQAQAVVSFAGAAGTEVTAGARVGVVATTPDPPPTFDVQTTGTIPDSGGGVGSIDLPVLASDAGAAGNVAADAIAVPVTPLPGVTAIVNAAPSYGGRDAETDDSLRAKTLDAVLGQGPGTIRDYVRWVGGWPGVGLVKVVPVWDGAGTVLTMASDPDGQPLPLALITGLQQDLDPVPGKGSGTAPVGATVTAATSNPVAINVVAPLEFLPGFSWDGTGATVAVGADVMAAVQRYLLGLDLGDAVSYTKVAGIFSSWPGVKRLTSMAAFTLNGGTADIALGLGPPPDLPTLGTVTLV